MVKIENLSHFNIFFCYGYGMSFQILILLRMNCVFRIDETGCDSNYRKNPKNLDIRKKAVISLKF